jgi:hypothetical protein
LIGPESERAIAEAMVAVLDGWPPWDAERARRHAVGLLIGELTRRAPRLPIQHLLEHFELRRLAPSADRRLSMLDMALACLPDADDEHARTVLLGRLAGLFVARAVA